MRVRRPSYLKRWFLLFPRFAGEENEEDEEEDEKTWSLKAIWLRPRIMLIISTFMNWLQNFKPGYVSLVLWWILMRTIIVFKPFINCIIIMIMIIIIIHIYTWNWILRRRRRERRGESQLDTRFTSSIAIFGS